MGNFFEPQRPATELLITYQYMSDYVIAVACIILSLEIFYSVIRTAGFPYRWVRWVLSHLGAFIALCGATHLLSFRMYTPYTMTVEILQTIAKFLVALVSSTTAILLIHIIPGLLNAKRWELFLKDKPAELDQKAGLIRTQEETGRLVRMHATTVLSSLMQETELTPELRLVAEIALKCSNFLSRAEDGTQTLESEEFDLRSAL